VVALVVVVVDALVLEGNGVLVEVAARVVLAVVVVVVVVVAWLVDLVLVEGLAVPLHIFWYSRVPSSCSSVPSLVEIDCRTHCEGCPVLSSNSNELHVNMSVSRHLSSHSSSEMPGKRSKPPPNIIASGYIIHSSV